MRHNVKLELAGTDKRVSKESPEYLPNFYL